jgi:hypothetical protein
MNWTKEFPTKPGWYWWRENPAGHSFVIYFDDGFQCVYTGSSEIPEYREEWTGERWGPIPAPDKDGKIEIEA